MIRAVAFFCWIWLFSPLVTASQIYIPDHLNHEKAWMVVVIHGCLQSADAMAFGSGWNQRADHHNLVILYPQVPLGSHPIDCWSWFLPENQGPGRGQLEQIHSEVIKWKEKLKIPNAPVFVVGFSSGATTAAGLLACYPDDFAAGAIHSGTSYGLAENRESALHVMKDGPPVARPASPPCEPTRFKGPVIILQGLSDEVVNPNHVQRLIADFLQGTELRAVGSQLSGGLHYRVDDYLQNGHLRGRVVRVKGLGHAWSGMIFELRHNGVQGPDHQRHSTVVPYFASGGPSSTELIYHFFQEVMSP